MRFPICMVNCKAYKQAVGKNALRLAKIAKAVSKKTKVSIILCVQAADIGLLAHHTSLPIFAQHVDVEPGAHTGNMEIESVIASGAKGTLLNHAERKLSYTQIKERILVCKKKRFPVVLCAPNPRTAKKLARLRPAAIAVEPPSLIGTGVSVSQAKPDMIATCMSLPLPVLCGAGISSEEDVRKALQLGAQGVLVASAVTMAKNQQQALLALARGFTQKH